MIDDVVDDDQADATSVREWLAGWGAEVAARRFAAAEQRFAADVVGFGTRAAAARGRRALRTEQWEHVWPAIDDFAFDVDHADVWVSPDRRQAIVAAEWHSSGRTPDGGRFPRGGRATVVLTRDATEAAWIGLHTHFSLRPVDAGTTIGTDA